jgi:precorrin-6B methylase 2
MTVREQDWLYNKAKVMDSIVEIGCWKGKSTHALCSGAKGMVTAVDHFKGGNSEIERKVHHRDAKNAEAEFMKYVGSRFSNLELIVSDSLSAAKSMTDRKFEMVFIDGSHDDKQVTLDLQAWEPKATKLISGHDYTNMEPVQKAVNDYFGQDNVRTFDSIWFVEK